MNRWLLLLPLGIFIAILVWLGVGVMTPPKSHPSALLNQQVPAFSLPSLMVKADPIKPFANRNFTDLDLRQGRATVVNFFASWCAPCRIESPILLELQAAGVPIIAIAYKDKPEAITQFLSEFGNPFDTIALDQEGRIGIDWGIYGVPESFIVDGGGIIRQRLTGALTSELVQNQILPLINRLNHP